MDDSLLYLGLIVILYIFSELVKHLVGETKKPQRTAEPNKQPEYRVRWREMMLGVGVGDAFGVGIEMKSRDWMERVDFTRYMDERPEGWREGYSAGKYSDDAEMTIGTVKLLMSGKEVTVDSMVQAWLDEYNEGIKKYGYGRQGHGSILRYYKGEITMEEVRNWQKDRKYPGNAPPMRAIPLAFTGSNLYNYAIINADSTHPHPKARASSVLTARAAEYVIIKRGKLLDIIKNLKHEIKELDQETFDYLEAVDKLPAYNIGGPEYSFNDPKNVPSDKDILTLCGPQPFTLAFGEVTGLNSDAMRTAGCVLYLLKFYRDPMYTLRTCMRIGGDVDSLGSICLGIVGARFGLDGIPSFMIDELEDHEGLSKLGEAFGAFVESQQKRY